jgi:hypothetical protein
MMFRQARCKKSSTWWSAKACMRAVEHIGGMARGFLYLEVVTAQDAVTVCDTSKSDLEIHLRKGAWYRKLLAPYFRELGCGLYYAHKGPALFYELEAPPLRKRASG